MSEQSASGYGSRGEDLLRAAEDSACRELSSIESGARRIRAGLAGEDKSAVSASDTAGLQEACQRLTAALAGIETALRVRALQEEREEAFGYRLASGDIIVLPGRRPGDPGRLHEVFMTDVVGVKHADMLVWFRPWQDPDAAAEKFTLGELRDLMVRPASADEQRRAGHRAGRTAGQEQRR